MRNSILAAVCLAVTTACGAYVFPGGGASPSPAMGAVAGRVLAVPCAPVEQAGSSCAGKPVAGLEIDYLSGKSVVAKTITDANGVYSIELPQGTYDVRFNGFMRVISGPTRISIAAGSSVTANYVLDSGIRGPAAE